MVDPGGSQNLTLPPRIYPLFVICFCKCLRIPEYTPPSQNIPPPFSNYMRPSQNLPLTPRIYPLFNKCICATSQNIPHFNNYMRPSQNLLLPLRIYPPFQQLYATLSEFTPHSQNTPPFSTNVYVRPPRIYSSLLEYTPLCNKCIYMCDPPRIYPSLPPSQNTPPFSTTICDPPRIYPPSQNLPPPRIYLLFNNYNIMRRSRNLALPPRTYPPFSTTICDPPRIYLSLPEYTLFSTTICDPPRIYPSLPEYTPIFNNHIIIRRSQNLSLPPRIHPFSFFCQLYPSYDISLLHLLQLHAIF